jgi:hypothetical protein
VGSRRVGELVERGLDALVGETPRAVGPGAWREHADEEARAHAERPTSELPRRPRDPGEDGT